MVTKITDPKIQAIDSIQKAKEADIYNGKALTEQAEKDLFDSDLLKKDDGTDDLDKIRMAAWLLANYKEGKVIIKTEKMGLSQNAHEVLTVLIGEKKAASEVYQAVNQIGNNQPIDKVITQFEDILFAESDPFFDQKIEAAALAWKGFLEQIETLDSDITKLEKEWNPKIVKEQTDLRDKIVNFLVPRLKDDLQTPGVGGRPLLDFIIENNKNSLKAVYSSDLLDGVDIYGSAYYGSVIKTGYVGNSKPYTNHMYLAEDLPGQIWTLLKEIDETKLYSYIFSSDCSWTNDQKEKFRKIFDRLLGHKILGGSFKNKRGRIGQIVLLPHKLSDKTKDVIKGTRFYISDIFYIMNAFFPKDSNYQDSPFIKVGEKSCLQFNNSSKDLDTPYDIYWRGADASIIGKNYIADGGGVNILDVPLYIPEEKKLTWANGQIPEFFWQVYNNDEAIDFNAYDEVLSSDAVNFERVREEKITVYEKKIIGRRIQRRQTNFLIRNNYENYVGKLIKNAIGADGNLLFKEDEVNKLEAEWKKIAGEIALKVHMNTFVKFRNDAKGLTSKELEARKSEFDQDQLVHLMLSGEVTEEDTVSQGVINMWDGWITKADAVIEHLEAKGAKLGEKLSEQRTISAKEIKARAELKAARKLKEDAKKGRADGLINQFKTIRDKPGLKSYLEFLFMRNVLGWIKKWDNLKTDATFDVNAEIARLEAAEKVNGGELAKYSNWVRLGHSFINRLDNWKEGDGKYFNEEAVRAYLDGIKDSLESVTGRELDPVEQNELDEITDYIRRGPTPPEKRILPMELKVALGTKINVFSETVKKWIDYPSSINFKGDAEEIRKIADKVNKGDKINRSNFIKYLKETLAKKPGMTDEVPDDKDKDQDWLDWFFTQDPKVVIGTIALQELKVDSNLKAHILDEMKKFKGDQKGLIRLDLNVYGDGNDFTEEGIIKFYTEQLGGQNHASKKYQSPFQDSIHKPPFWRTNNFAAWLSGMGLLLLLAGTIWAILKRKTLLQWWNAPSELEEELDEDEEED